MKTLIHQTAALRPSDRTWIQWIFTHTDMAASKNQQNLSGWHIDCILATPSVADILLQAGIKAYSSSEYSSHHRGLFIGIDAEMLLQGYIGELNNPSDCGISSSPKQLKSTSSWYLTPSTITLSSNGSKTLKQC
jgi:hypothetical protein